MVLPSSGLKHSYLLLSHHVAPEKTSVFVTWEKKGAIFTDSSLLSKGLHLPELGWMAQPVGSPVLGWANLRAPRPVAVPLRWQMLPEHPPGHWVAGGEAGTHLPAPSPGDSGSSTALFVSVGVNVS